MSKEGGRPFRTEASLRSERMARIKVPEILRQRGYQIKSDRLERNGQSLEVLSPSGDLSTYRIKLCWRWDEERTERNSNNLRYSAAQLMARITGDDWEGSIREKMNREQEAGSTHYLFTQMQSETVVRAASLPLTSVLSVWNKQRETSEQLIATGKLGRRKKNHATNGRSPTIWLQDDRGGQAVADKFWKHSDVIDILAMPTMGSLNSFPDDLDPTKTYIEGAARKVVVNGYERDEKARLACIAHYKPICAICEMEFGKVYGTAAQGLIHVHHLRPISEPGESHEVDPIRDLRPVCPNCHAVIHFGGKCRSIEEVRKMIRSH